MSPPEPGPGPAELLSYAAMRPTPELPTAEAVECDSKTPDVLRVLVPKPSAWPMNEAEQSR